MNINWNDKEVLLNINWNHEKKISSRFLRTLKDEIVYGGYFAAMIGPGLVMTTSIITKINVTIPLLIISYLIPLMVYSYDYYKDMDKDKDSNLERAAHFNKKSNIYPYMMGSYALILSILLLVFSNVMMISFILILIVAGVLYTVGLKKFTQKIPAFKNVYTVLTWSLAGAFSLAFFNSLAINLTYILIFLFIFLKMLPNAFFFDLKDIKSDQKDGLKTIPVILGKPGTLKLLHRMNIVAFIPLLIGIYLKIIPLFAAILVLFFFYSMYYLRKSNKIEGKELRMVTYTLADAEFMLWPIALIIGKSIGF